MNTRPVIAAADPARTLSPEALDLDVDALLLEFTTGEADAEQDEPGPMAPRRRRLDLALAAVLVALLAAVAFLPASFAHGPAASRSTNSTTSTPTATSSASAARTATALLDEITVPAAANPVSAPPAEYLRAPRTGLACKGQASAEPRYWIVPGMTVQTVAAFLEAHRPASASRLPFDQHIDGDTSDAFTLYRPAAHSEVVIALAETPAGVGIRADADVFLGSSCVFGTP